jgi:hypothetical protein
MTEPLVDLRWADHRSPARLAGWALGLGVLGAALFLGGLVPVGGQEAYPWWGGVLLLGGLGLCAAALGMLLGAAILVLRRGVRGRAHTRPIVSWGPPGSRPEKGAEPVPYGTATRAAREQARRDVEGPTAF